MPYGKCRDCVYCRTDWGASVREVADLWEIAPDDFDEISRKLYLNADPLYCCRKAPSVCITKPYETLIGKDKKGKWIQIEDVMNDFTIPFIPMVTEKVCDGKIGCGEFEPDKK